MLAARDFQEERKEVEMDLIKIVSELLILNLFIDRNDIPSVDTGELIYLVQCVFFLKKNIEVMNSSDGSLVVECYSSMRKVED